MNECDVGALEWKLLENNRVPKRLPFPSRTIVINGCEEIEEYQIPDDWKVKILKMLYPFKPLPDLSDTFEDLCEGKRFRVYDYKVIRRYGQLWLMSPYWISTGGQVIDWVQRRSGKIPIPGTKAFSSTNYTN